MKKMIFLFLILLCMGMQLYCINQMPLMQTFKGRCGNSWIGRTMTSIDFNADGFDDLVVFANVGPRIDIFFGGVAMDTIPDFSLVSQFPGQYTDTSLINTGDQNGDGHDDLCVMRRFETEPDSCALNFYYGGPSADLVPDYEIVTSMWDYNPKIMPQECIGDVNNDGFDDLGILYWSDNYSPDLAVMLGGTHQIIIIQPYVSGRRLYRITRAGDINGDGIDDYIAGYALYHDFVVSIYRYLYFGGNPLNLDNRVLLHHETDTRYWCFPGGYGIGDFNGDGFDDFVYSNANSYYDDNKLRMGATDILNSPDLTLHSSEYYPNLLNMEVTGIAYGDFNGDGYSDVAGTNYRAYTWTGIAGVWLGNAVPNGQNDLMLNTPPTSPFHQFGWQLESGDFNGDGFCDLAISAPQSSDNSPWYFGYVYIFSGNAQLADTTVSNEDNVDSITNDRLHMTISPNPFNPSTTISFLIPKESNVKVTMYNIKGQIVKRLCNESMKKGLHKLVWDGKNDNGRSAGSGIYFIRLETQDKVITQKAMMLK